MTWLNSNMTKHVYACYLCSISYKTEASPWLWNNSRHYGNTSDPGFNNNKKSCFFIVLLQLSNSAKTASYFPTHKEQPRSWAQSPSCRVNHLTLVTTYPKLIWETEWVPLRLRKALITVMIGMMRIRKMKTRVCQTGKLQCTLPEVSLKQHVSCYIIQIFATWAISGHEPMLYILFRQH